VRQRWSLFLNLFATTTQRDDLAVLSNSSDRRPAALIRRSRIGRNVFGTSDPEKFPQVVIPPPKLFHPVLDRIRVERISRIVWHLSSSPMSGFILLLTDERTFTLVNILPAEDLFSRQRIQLWTGWDLIRSFVRHPIAPYHRRGKRIPTALCVIGTSDIP